MPIQNLEKLKSMATAAVNQATSDSNVQKQPNKIWVNVGYVQEVDGKESFVSLPSNIALETMSNKKEGKTKSDYTNLVVAQNFLREQLLERAATMKPGESIIVPLQVQLLVEMEEVPASKEDNPFIKKIF